METGNLVRFSNERDGGPVHRITRVAADGMVELNDMGGLFAPCLFVLADDIADIPCRVGTARPDDLRYAARTCNHLGQIERDILFLAADEIECLRRALTETAYERLEELKGAFVAGCCATLSWCNAGMPTDDLEEAGYDYARTFLAKAGE